MNILVGSNNSGKSTILSAFRALEAGLRRARTKSAERVMGLEGIRWGYRISEEALPITIENVHTDYAETDTTVTFRLSNANKLQLYFPPSGGCILLPETPGKLISKPKAFKEAFPITIGIVPVLGPVENDELLLSKETVQRDLATHRASRHFRNYWYYYPDGFEDFAALIKRTWPGMEIQSPEMLDVPQGKKFLMFCLENRIPRELYWSGFGFQIWCQLLTHVARSSDNSLLVVDEPEVYLHPDVQRQLLSILRDAGPDIIIATHSTEIMSEADPSEILLVEKSKQSAKRLRDIEGVQAALDAVGSIQNITLTQLAKNRRLLFTEGSDDYKILRRFASRLGLTELSSGNDITAVESGGFSSWERIRAFAWGLEKTIGNSLRIGAIFDRDYLCLEEVDKILADLNQHLDFAHIHPRKEIENYLLVPEVLEKALKKALIERSRRTREEIIEPKPICQMLDYITSPHRSVIQGQYIAKRTKYFEHSKRDKATIMAETIDLFDLKWQNISTRMEIVPGKEVLRALRDKVQSEYGVSLTDARIIDEFKREDIPNDLNDLVNRLEKYRRNAC
jgi:hypothetical protein